MWTESDITNELQLQNLFFDAIGKWFKKTSKKLTKDIFGGLTKAHDDYLGWHDKARDKIIKSTVGAANFVGDEKRIDRIVKVASDAGSLVG